MSTRTRISAASLFWLGGLTGLLCAVGVAGAQTNTTGAVRGVVRDIATGGPLADATIVATSELLQGERAETTDANGAYHFDALPPGEYELTVVYGGAFASRPAVIVSLGKLVAINISVDAGLAKGKNVTIVEPPHVIDLGSSKTGVTITPEFYRNIPTGRSFGSTLTAASGSQDDTYGVSFGGSTSPENVYYVDGINVTEADYGRLGTNVANDFIRETEVVTGAYNAEYGRSTGGVTNVITKTGSNEFHGSVFTNYAPTQLANTEKFIPKLDSALNYQGRNGHIIDSGIEIGGPIIKDKLWFYTGYDPSFEQKRLWRRIDGFVDEDMDGVVDVDSNNEPVRNLIERRVQKDETVTHNFIQKLSWAPGQDHQGTLVAFGNPTSRSGVNDLAVLERGAGRGNDDNMLIEARTGAVDFVGRWTSRFFDSHTEVDAVVGYHSQRNSQWPKQLDDDVPSVRYLYPRPMTDFAAFEDVPSQCQDGGSRDPYPMIVNCPFTNYSTGGPFLSYDYGTTRMQAHISATQRFNLLGRHRAKVGFDSELTHLDSRRRFSGGTTLVDFGGVYQRLRWAGLDEQNGAPCGEDLDGDGVPDGGCSDLNFLETAVGTTHLGAFVQDSWEILPYLTLNAGLRWEQQKLGTADDLHGRVSPLNGQPIGETALTLSNMLAPRVGLIYDWTREGRSRVFANYGRFYQAMPLDLNNRAFGGEIIHASVFLATDCSDPAASSITCPQAGTLYDGYIGGGTTLVQPGLKPMSLDEMVFGSEYELTADIKVGASFIRRKLNRAIEDVYVNGGATAVIANPGQIHGAALQDLRDEAAQLEADGDAMGAARLDGLIGGFEQIGNFDKAKRVYNALEVSAQKRFSNMFMVMGSYTYAKTEGNYPGLFSPENQQLDPNYTSMYDLPDLLANRTGDLAHDRPHQVKIDGYVQPQVGPGILTVGSSFRAISGRPSSILGSHAAYGANESYILPRGTGERSPAYLRLDLLTSYGMALSQQMRLDFIVQVYNALNLQQTLRRDEAYTYNPVNPIVGGDADDLAHLKDATTGAPVALNGNFGRELEVQAPRYVRFGVRLTF